MLQRYCVDACAGGKSGRTSGERVEGIYFIITGNRPSKLNLHFVQLNLTKLSKKKKKNNMLRGKLVDSITPELWCKFMIFFKLSTASSTFNWELLYNRLTMEQKPFRPG